MDYLFLSILEIYNLHWLLSILGSLAALSYQILTNNQATFLPPKGQNDLMIHIEHLFTLKEAQQLLYPCPAEASRTCDEPQSNVKNVTFKSISKFQAFHLHVATLTHLCLRLLLDAGGAPLSTGSSRTVAKTQQEMTACRGNLMFAWSGGWLIFWGGSAGK